jgi:hypothetical protein
MLQPSLLDMHRNSIDWLSATMLWKREVTFFQKLLDKYSPLFNTEEDKKKVSHFQSLITYYNGELIDQLRTKLRDHENLLARTLQEYNESDTRYYQQHKGLMNELESFANSFNTLKHDLFEFIEKAL